MEFLKVAGLDIPKLFQALFPFCATQRLDCYICFGPFFVDMRLIQGIKTKDHLQVFAIFFTPPVIEFSKKFDQPIDMMMKVMIKLQIC